MARCSLRLPGFAYAGHDPDGFRDEDEVTAVERGPTDARFLARTHDVSYVQLGVISATNLRRGVPEQGPTPPGRAG